MPIIFHMPPRSAMYCMSQNKQILVPLSVVLKFFFYSVAYVGTMLFQIPCKYIFGELLIKFGKSLNFNNNKSFRERSIDKGLWSKQFLAFICKAVV